MRLYLLLYLGHFAKNISFLWAVKLSSSNFACVFVCVHMYTWRWYAWFVCVNVPFLYVMCKSVYGVCDISGTSSREVCVHVFNVVCIIYFMWGMLCAW